MKLNSILLVIFIPLILNSCIGPSIKSSTIGRKYNCKIVKDFDKRSISSIGVFAVPNLFERFTKDLSLEYSEYPEEITLNSIYKETKGSKKTDSLVMQKAMEQLNFYGYNTKCISDLFVVNKMSTDSIAKFAQSKNFDAVFIIYYNSYSSWHENNEIQINFNNLILPSCALIDCNTKEILWSSQYYGIIEQAHYFNIIGSHYAYLVPEFVTPYSSNNLEEAAQKAIEMIFNPANFKKNFIPFPVRH